MPHRIFNVYPRKGSVSVGADADLVVWDPERTRTISAKTHHQKIDFNVFERMRVKGIPSYTLTRGSVAWANGNLEAVRGAGKHIERPTFSAPYEALAKLNAARVPQPVARG